MNRKDFLIKSAIGTSGLLLFKPTFGQTQEKKEKEKIAQLKPELVKDFVGKAHKDKDAVVKLYTEYPTLLNSAWDWGGGDFETALGAASHVGYIELVNYLIEQGAQMNFLTLCLLGKTEIVKSIVEINPNVLNMKGPHGFTPLHHAINGGDNALEVKAFLESKGAKEKKIPLVYPKS